MLARLWPAPVTAGEDLARSIRFLRWDVDPTRTVRAGYGLGMLVTVTGVAFVFAAGIWSDCRSVAKTSNKLRSERRSPLLEHFSEGEGLTTKACY